MATESRRGSNPRGQCLQRDGRRGIVLGEKGLGLGEVLVFCQAEGGDRGLLRGLAGLVFGSWCCRFRMSCVIACSRHIDVRTHTLAYCTCLCVCICINIQIDISVYKQGYRNVKRY